jgi:hypothetical protein
MSKKSVKRKGSGRDAGREPRWRDLISRHRAGEMRVREFCAAQGVAESAFYYWRRELERRDSEKKTRGAQSSGAFVPVRLGGGFAAPVELELASGRVLRLGGAFEPARVAELVKLLEA